MNFCPICGAKLKAASGAVGKMIEDYRKRLADKPEDADAHYNLALAYLQAHDEELAEVELRRVFELEPSFADAHVRLAGIYLRQGKTEPAESQLRKALEVEADHAEAKRLLEQLKSRPV
jgi:Tfp pilus assembly protein PilF